MAERAAEAIGADPLLARVAAYYHDIGKAVQPFFFIVRETLIAIATDSESLRTANTPMSIFTAPQNVSRIEKSP